MTDYVLEVSSWSGFAPGAVHYRGRVKGPHPRSCHGGMTFNHPDARGKYTCEQRHEIPQRVEWDVDAYWTSERYERWAAKQFDGDGPGQFLDEPELLKVAVQRFSGHKGEADEWWAEKGAPGQPGDRLFYAYPPGMVDPVPPWTGEGMPEYGALLVEASGPVREVIGKQEEL